MAPPSQTQLGVWPSLTQQHRLGVIAVIELRFGFDLQNHGIRKDLDPLLRTDRVQWKGECSDSFVKTTAAAAYQASPNQTAWLVRKVSRRCTRPSCEPSSLPRSQSLLQIYLQLGDRRCGLLILQTFGPIRGNDGAPSTLGAVCKVAQRYSCNNTHNIEKSKSLGIFS